jgi:hypothetical protein
MASIAVRRIAAGRTAQTHDVKKADRLAAARFKHSNSGTSDVDDVHELQHAEADRQDHQHCGDKPEFVGLRVNGIGLVLNLDLVHAPFSIDVRAQDTMIVTMIALRPMKPPAMDQAQTSALVALKDCHVGRGVERAARFAWFMRVWALSTALSGRRRAEAPRMPHEARL